eukprot:15455929-Alexandrium_andersonii.AAC.1
MFVLVVNPRHLKPKGPASPPGAGPNGAHLNQEAAQNALVAAQRCIPTKPRRQAPVGTKDPAGPQVSDPAGPPKAKRQAAHPEWPV